MAMQRFDQINVIPFIDIMLVLLAIVLTTATFISQGQIEVSLPEAQSAQPFQSQSEALEIIINADNQFFLAGKAVNTEALALAIQKVSKETAVVLRVDKQVVFANFVQVIDLLKHHHHEKFSIVTIEK